MRVRPLCWFPQFVQNNSMRSRKVLRAFLVQPVRVYKHSARRAGQIIPNALEFYKLAFLDRILPVFRLNDGFVSNSSFLEFPVHVNLVWCCYTLKGLIALDGQIGNFVLIVNGLEYPLNQNLVREPRIFPAFSHYQIPKLRNSSSAGGPLQTRQSINLSVFKR